MSTWDEKAEDHAVAHHTMEHQRIMHNETRYRLFAQGARWQREALLSDESVERAARAIDPDVFFMSKTEWEAQNDHVEGDYENARLEALGTARAALTAAIEGDE